MIAEVGGVEPERIVVVSGPNLAREIAVQAAGGIRRRVVERAMAERVAAACAAPYFRPYTGADVVGHRDRAAR